MRYKFSIFEGYVWHDMFFHPRYFWGMWGVRVTLRYIVIDTLREIIENINPK